MVNRRVQLMNLLGAGRRKRGKGFGDFISGTLGGIGSGVGSGVHNLLGSLFGGKRPGRRRVVRRKPGPKRGRAHNLSYVVRPVGLGRRRRRRGGAAEEAPAAPTSLIGRINKIAKDSGIINKALGEFGFSGLSNAAKTLGYGRRHRGGSYRTIVW